MIGLIAAISDPCSSDWCYSGTFKALHFQVIINRNSNDWRNSAEGPGKIFESAQVEAAHLKR